MDKVNRIRRHKMRWEIKTMINSAQPWPHNNDLDSKSGSKSLNLQRPPAVKRGSSLDKQLRQRHLSPRGEKKLRNCQQQKVDWDGFHRRAGNNWYSEKKKNKWRCQRSWRATRTRLSKYDNVSHIAAKILMWQLKRKEGKK